MLALQPSNDFPVFLEQTFALGFSTCPPSNGRMLRFLRPPSHSSHAASLVVNQLVLWCTGSLWSRDQFRERHVKERERGREPLLTQVLERKFCVPLGLNT